MTQSEAFLNENVCKEEYGVVMEVQCMYLMFDLDLHPKPEFDLTPGHVICGLEANVEFVVVDSVELETDDDLGVVDSAFVVLCLLGCHIYDVDSD